MYKQNMFDHLDKDWWDQQGSMKGLHAMNIPRMEYIKSHIEPNGINVLDVGCGGGILTEALAKDNANVIGIDIASPLIACAKKHASKQKLTIDYKNIPIESLDAKFKQHFDLITCMELLEHVDDPELILNHCHRALKPNGILIVSTLNRTIKSYLLGIVAAEYVLNVVPKGTHEYQKFIKPSEMAKLLKKHNFLTTCIKGLNYNPFTNKSFITTDVSVNYILAAKKINA